MALPDSAFTTLAQAKTVLSITGSGDDAEVERLITAISSGIRKYLNRPLWEEQTVADAPMRVLSPRHLAVIPWFGPVPITTITDIKLDGSELTVADFGHHLPNFGVLSTFGELS